jgi:DNA (cytosine-5)-methyltransferase 1
VDCIHAGFPCQDISHAGKQAGVGTDTRSGLYREVLRIADVVRPQCLYLENVAAILSGGLGTVLGDLAARGYDCRWTCLRAADLGAPHGRDRWWCLAIRDTDSDSEPTSAFDAQAPRLCGHPIDSNAVGVAAQGLEQGSSDAQEWARPDIRPARPLRDGHGWWQSEPDLGRVADGVAARVDRLKALGNGQVPLQAALAWRILAGGV